MSNLKNKKINICILEMSSQNKAILEFFFDNSGKSLFEETNLDNASAYIVDYDYPDAKEHAEEIHSKYHIPGIIISIKEVEKLDTVWIAKPLTINALTIANKQISTIISEITEKKEQASSLTSSNKTINKSQEKVLDSETLLTDEVEKEKELLSNNLSNVEQQETNNLHNKSINAKQTINDNVPAIAGLTEIPYETDREIKIENETELEIQSEPTSANNEIDDLLFELSATQTDDLIIENSPPQSEEPDSDISEIEEPMLEFESIHADLPKTSNSSIDHDNSNNQFDSSASLEMDKDGFLGLDLSDKENTASEQEQATDIVVNLEDSIQDLQNEVELTLETQELETQLQSPAEEKEPPSLDSTNNISFTENIIDDSLTTGLTTEDLQTKEDLSIIAEEIKPDSILEQVNEQLNDDLLNIDTFSVESNTSKKPATQNRDDLLEKTHPKETLLSDDNDINDLLSANLSADSTTDPDSYKDTNLDATISELSADVNTNLESSSPSNSNQTFEKSVPPLTEETVVSSDTSTTNDTEPTLSAEEELQTLLEEIRLEAEGKNPNLITTNRQGSNTQRHTPTFAEERWALTCGNNDSISSQQSPYLPGDYMLSTLLKVVDKSKSTEKVMRLKFNGIIIVVIPDSLKIFCDTSIYKDTYAEVCFNPISQENIKIHYLDTSEIRQYKKAINEDSELSHSIEAFIWTTSLLTSRGRLPHGTDLKRTVAIKYWPDLTRVETFPHIMQIAAVFYKHPGSLKDIPTWLGIEQRYIYAFYNGVLALRLMELDQKQLSLQTHKSGSFKKTENRGFFSRLLKRINT